MQLCYNPVPRLSGTPPATSGYSYEDHLAHCAMRGDSPDTIADQLAWMRETAKRGL